MFRFYFCFVHFIDLFIGLFCKNTFNKKLIYTFYDKFDVAYNVLFFFRL